MVASNKGARQVNDNHFNCYDTRFEDERLANFVWLLECTTVLFQTTAFPRKFHTYLCLWLPNDGHQRLALHDRML
jgi:hypothetical protein